MTEAKHPKRLASKFLGTAVLALSLVGLHGSLWYFRPQLVGETSSLNHNSVVSTYGSSRKLLEFNISVVSGQKVSAMGELDHARKKVKSSSFYCSHTQLNYFVIVFDVTSVVTEQEDPQSFSLSYVRGKIVPQNSPAVAGAISMVIYM